MMLGMTYKCELAVELPSRAAGVTLQSSAAGARAATSGKSAKMERGATVSICKAATLRPEMRLLAAL
jgi:hypothetical protein